MYQSLTTVSDSQLFGSVVRALGLYRGTLCLIPSQGVGIFSDMFHTCCGLEALEGLIV